jgi:hypothetical protein
LSMTPMSYKATTKNPLGGRKLEILELKCGSDLIGCKFPSEMRIGPIIPIAFENHDTFWRGATFNDGKLLWRSSFIYFLQTTLDNCSLINGAGLAFSNNNNNNNNNFDNTKSCWFQASR